MTVDANTLSLLHFDSGLADEAGNTWTAYNGANISSTKSKFGGKSLYLNGSQYIESPSNIPIYGSSNFTIDLWSYMTNTSAQAIVSKSTSWSDNNDFYLYYAGGNLIFTVGNLVLSLQGGITINQWNHIAIVRDGNNWYMFVNGILKTSTVSNVLIPNGTTKVMIGRHISLGQSYLGYIDELRFSNTARWIANFTPPTGASGSGGSTLFPQII